MSFWCHLGRSKAQNPVLRSLPNAPAKNPANPRLHVGLEAQVLVSPRKPWVFLKRCPHFLLFRFSLLSPAFPACSFRSCPASPRFPPLLSPPPVMVRVPRGRGVRHPGVHLQRAPARGAEVRRPAGDLLRRHGQHPAGAHAACECSTAFFSERGEQVGRWRLVHRGVQGPLTFTPIRGPVGTPGPKSH